MRPRRLVSRIRPEDRAGWSHATRKRNLSRGDFTAPILPSAISLSPFLFLPLSLFFYLLCLSHLDVFRNLLAPARESADARSVPLLSPAICLAKFPCHRQGGSFPPVTFRECARDFANSLVALPTRCKRRDDAVKRARRDRRPLYNLRPFTGGGGGGCEGADCYPSACLLALAIPTDSSSLPPSPLATNVLLLLHPATSPSHFPADSLSLAISIRAS